MARVRLGRVYHFAAAHRLHSPFLSDEENLELYRDCNFAAGHGHNYVLTVVVEGEVAPRTGMIGDLGALDRVVQAQVLDRYDHRFIGQREYAPGVPAFISTGEEIARQIWAWLVGALPPGLSLSRVKLEETPRNHFEYRGEAT